MNPENPYGDIDVTSYLQTEGRRRAAELASKPSGSADAAGALARPVSSTAPSIQQDATHNNPPAQEQHASTVRQAGSLTEVLRQMGVTGGGRRTMR